MPPSAFLSPAQRFAGIVNGLFLAIMVRRDTGFLAAPVANLLWTRLAHLRSRVRRLAELLASGKDPGVPRRMRAPDGTDEASAPTDRQPRRPPQRLLPHGAGWMIRLVPEAAGYGSQLQFLLADPEMAVA